MDGEKNALKIVGENAYAGRYFALVLDSRYRKDASPFWICTVAKLEIYVGLIVLFLDYYILKWELLSQHWRS
jgi:hypothetical protein